MDTYYDYGPLLQVAGILFFLIGGFGFSLWILMLPYRKEEIVDAEFEEVRHKPYEPGDNADKTI